MSFVRELVLKMDSYYSVLGVGTESSADQIRCAYRKLAMQWHPDKWIRNPTHLAEANRKFQQIQKAYSVLSDRNKRAMYDAGIYYSDDEDDDDVEGFGDFLQEMASLINDARKKEKSCSIEELQGMFWEMAKGFEIPEWDGSPQQSCDESQWFYGPRCNQFETRSSSVSSWDSSMFHQGSRLFSKPEFFSH